MACSSAEVKVENSSRLLDNINTLNVFGKCQEEDLVFIKNEKKGREDQFKKAQMEVERERKRQEKLRREEYIADREFSNEERKNSSTGVFRNETATNDLQRSRGRGYLLNGPVKSEYKEKISPGHGHSRLTTEDKKRLSLYEREERVQRNISQFGEPNLHSNKTQERYWQQMGLDHQEEDSHTNTNFGCSTPDSICTEQFEDACDTQSSSPLSFSSVMSRASISPTSLPLSQSELAAASTDSPLETQKTTPCKQRRNRIAARFSNPDEFDIEKEQIPEAEEQQDALAVLGSSQPSLRPSGLRMGFRSTGVPFNSLRPSQRILSNDVLQHKDILYHSHASNACTSNDYAYNVKDFPPL